MAIKFVDKEPEDAGESKKAAAPKPEKVAEDVQTEPKGGQVEGQLPFAKPPTKKRGRK